MDLVIKDLWLPREGDIKELLIDSEGNVQITVIKNGMIIRGKTKAVEVKSDKPIKKRINYDKVDEV